MPQPHDNKLRIVIIPGSVRPRNFTNKAVALVIDEINKNDMFAVDVINLAELNMQFPGLGEESSAVKQFKQTVFNATGIIIATPEYHGSFSAATKLAIENLGFPSAISGKPIALLGVAAGAIGAIKSLEQLRGVCSHIGAMVLPGPVSVPKIQSVFDDAGRCIDPAIEKRIRGVGTTLIEYIESHVCPRIALEEMVRGSVQSTVIT